MAYTDVPSAVGTLRPAAAPRLALGAPQPDRRRALKYLHPIYALVIASLIAPAVALALSVDTWKSLYEVFELFAMWDRSWIGTTKNYDSDWNRWNGVWPNGNVAIYSEPGGVIKEHIERWQELARSGADVEILGPCYSACTLIVTYVPKDGCALALLLRCNSTSLRFGKLENRL